MSKILNTVAIFSLLGLFSCSQITHEVVEDMKNQERITWISQQQSDVLCNGYQKEWARINTKLAIEAELATRGIVRCGYQKLGNESYALLKTRKFQRANPVQNIATTPETNSLSFDRNCNSFSSGAAAQKFFLASGGPILDPHNLDADGDGAACEWGTTVKRMLNIVPKNNNVSKRQPPSPKSISYRTSKKCYVGPRGGTYTITSGGNKNYRGC